MSRFLISFIGTMYHLVRKCSSLNGCSDHTGLCATFIPTQVYVLINNKMIDLLNDLKCSYPDFRTFLFTAQRRKSFFFTIGSSAISISVAQSRGILLRLIEKPVTGFDYRSVVRESTILL